MGARFRKMPLFIASFRNVKGRRGREDGEGRMGRGRESVDGKGERRRRSGRESDDWEGEGGEGLVKKR